MWRTLQKKRGYLLIRHFYLAAFFVLPFLGIAQTHYPGQHAGKFAIRDKLSPAVYGFDLHDVHLLDSRFTQNMQREEAWLSAIDVNSLLHSFRTNAGVYSGNEGGYSTVKKLAGWE